MKYDKIVILSIVLCLAVLVGEFLVYNPVAFRYDSDADLEDEWIQYSVSSSGSDVYSVVSLDNGSYSRVTSVYIYLDDTYDRFWSQVHSATDIEFTNQSYCADQIVKSLKVRGFEDVILCNAENLATLMADDLESEFSKGLIVTSYAISDRIYSGSSDNLLFQWLSSGGSLFWEGSVIGKYYTTEDELIEVTDSSELFFGKDCVEQGKEDLAYSKIHADGLTDALYLKSNSVKYGLDISGLSDAFAIGYAQGGYSSVSFVGYGKGMITVIGGDYVRNVCDDLAQIIASGVSYCSKVIFIEESVVKRTTVEGKIDCSGVRGSIVTYISIGGYYTVYGEAYEMEVAV